MRQGGNAYAFHQGGETLAFMVEEMGVGKILGRREAGLTEIM